LKGATLTWTKHIFCLLVFAFYSLGAQAGLLAAGEPRSFIFTSPGHYSDKPITVYYYKPKNASADSKLLFAIHGVERMGSRARDNWIDAAEKYGFIVVAPEFDSEHFPNKLFQMGGMENKDPAAWSFQIIENLFEKIRNEESLTTPAYMLFGHSAGAQYVHRFVLMMEKPRLSTAVAANAGAYTIPAYSNSRYPWALDERLTAQPRLKEVFARRLVILLGESDTKTSGGNLPSSQEAIAQGQNRLERGKNFYSKAQSQAQELKATLNWQLTTVPGVGHDSARMSKAAARILFDAP
jgi:poly(3-hydroxybutyrate) depolymerase